MSIEQFIFAGLIIFAAHLVSTVTGFGANVVGVPLLALVVGFGPGKQTLIALGAMQYTYITLRWWKFVDRRQLLWILLVAGIGLVLGMFFIEILPQRAATILLGIFVMLTGLRGLFDLAPNYITPKWLRQILLFLGGFVHGALTTGGPLLTIYCRSVLTDKSRFRATLGVMWLTFALMLMSGWTMSHAWSPATPHVILAGLPFLAAGLIAGEYLHHRVDEKLFARAVNLMLVIIGGILLITSRK